MAPVGELAALLSAATWSGTSVALTSLGSRVSPAALSTLRLSVASLLLPFILIATGGVHEITSASLATIAGIAGSGIVAYAVGDTIYIHALKSVGMQRTFPVTMALFIAFTVTGGIVLLGEDFAWGLVGGAVLIGIGIWLLTLAGTARAGDLAGPQRLQPRALLHLLAVGIIWTCATLWLAAAANDMGAVPANTLRASASCLSLIVFTVATDRPGLAAPFRNRTYLLAILAAGLVGTLFGSLAYVYAVTTAGAARTAVLQSTAPLMALPLSVIFLREPLTRRAVGGTLACVAGILLVVA